MDLSNARLVANIPAQDIERAMRWYQEKLGLRPTMDLGVAGQLYQSGGVYWLIYQTSAAGTGKHTVASWVVPSIDDAMRDMRAKGVIPGSTRNGEISARAYKNACVKDFWAKLDEEER